MRRRSRGGWIAGVPFVLLAVLDAIERPDASALIGLVVALVVGLAGFLLCEGVMRIARRFTGTTVRADGLLVQQALGVKALVRWDDVAGTEPVVFHGWRYLKIARSGRRGPVLMNLEVDDARAFHARLALVVPAGKPLRDVLDASGAIASEA